MKYLILSTILLLSPFCYARESFINDWPNREFLGDYLSNENEPLPDFIARLGNVLNEYTSQTGFEACGFIGVNNSENATKYGVSLYSDKVQRGCTMSQRDLPNGFLSTGETIHSHPNKQILYLTSDDVAWNKLRGKRVFTRTMTIEPGFSNGDLKAGAGWLIHHKVIRYFNGKSGKGRYVGVLSPIEMMPQKENN